MESEERTGSARFKVHDAVTAHRGDAAPRSGHRGMIILAAVLILALIGRAVAPVLIRNAINARLAEIPDYEGHVGDVDLALLRGACVVHGIELRKEGGAAGAPLLVADRIDGSLAWGELVRGRIRSEVHVDGAKVTVVRTESPETSQDESDERWQEAIEDLVPITISRFQVEGATFHYVDQTQDPHIDVSLHQVGIVAEGISNRRTEPGEGEEQLPAVVWMWGRTTGDGAVEATLRLAPLEPEPLFDLEFAIHELPLPAYNSLLRAYANVDVSHGYFDLALEVAASDGAFEGYVKPFFRELDFENVSDDQRGVLGRVWESIVNAMDAILKNPESEQVGTRVPFSGTFEETRVGTWSAIVNAVQYGFGAAFSESVEGSIEPSDVEAPEEQGG